MRRINQIKQIRDIILNHPLFPIAEKLAFKNNFQSILKKDLKTIFSNGQPLLQAITTFKQSAFVKKALEEKHFHYLSLFIESIEEAYLTEENFKKFLDEKIVSSTNSTEENNAILEKCKNVLTILGIFSDDIKPIQQEFTKYKEEEVHNSYDSIIWSKTEAAKLINIKRQTIYNWIKTEDFTNESGKVIVGQFRKFLQKYKPREYAIFQKKWNQQAD